MDIYREVILDHYKNPRNFGSLPGADKVAESSNATCGDSIRMEIRVNSKKGKSTITDIRFSGIGCAISQASASMLTEKVKGMPVTKVRTLGISDILQMLGTKLTPSRVKCATLPLEVIDIALRT